MNLNQKLENKNILFISVKFFNLEFEIKSKLERLGALVDFFDERPYNNNLIKGLLRVNKNFLNPLVNYYYKRIFSKIKNKNYDYLLVVKGEIVPSFFLESFKLKYPKTELIYYNWDSFKNNPYPLQNLKYYNHKYTFDPLDAVKYKLSFRPLFFLDDFKLCLSEKVKYNVLFLGTAHSDRYSISNKIFDWCNHNKLTYFYYYYMQGRMVYFLKLMLDKTFQKFDYKKLSFQKLSKSDIISLYNVSDVILDINHPEQNGLTMRTFEAIAARKKLITTNTEIMKYNFFNTNNICIIDRKNPILNVGFFKNKYEQISENQYYYLSIDGWVNTIFFER